MKCHKFFGFKFFINLDKDSVSPPINENGLKMYILIFLFTILEEDSNNLL